MQCTVLPAKLPRWAIVDAAHNEVFGALGIAVSINDATCPADVDFNAVPAALPIHGRRGGGEQALYERGGHPGDTNKTRLMMARLVWRNVSM